MNVAIPLIFSSFGWSLMVTCDRIMLAKFDLQVMNAVVVLGSLLFLFEWLVASITVTTEIFAGQYNGLGKKTMAPIATWQMLILCIFSLLIYIPCGLFLGKYIIPEIYYDSAGDFFKIIMCFLVFSPATSAINGFFIGIKKTKIIMLNTFSANILNILLSYIFIFGIEGYLKPMGALGAAIATSICLGVQFIIIFLVFLREHNHKTYKTREYKLDKNIFYQCLKLGIPSSVAMVTDIIGNYCILLMMGSYHPKYVSSYNIGLNVFIFVAFFLHGIHKAASGLAANIIGDRKIELIPYLLKSLLKLHLIFSSVIIALGVIFPEFTASFYTSDPEILYFAKITLPWVALNFIIDGVGWIVVGILIAGGDTFFVMVASIIILWVFKVLPLYILFELGISHIAIGWMVSTLGISVYTIVFYARYRSQRWLKLQLS